MFLSKQLFLVEKMKQLKMLVKNQKGATMVEYAIMLSLIALSLK